MSVEAGWRNQGNQAYKALDTGRAAELAASKVGEDKTLDWAQDTVERGV